ncbi:MAG: hypothetical protein QE271_03220 [Bacteriovoracaceae bacterium]|nr:hypothetical protein [Bacteriovoracaceae bacterium]
MNETIFYAHYSRTLKRNLNRLELRTPDSVTSKRGIYIKVKRGNLIGHGDYFPHELLGDISIEEFLDTFLLQRETSQKKCYHFAIQEMNKEFTEKCVPFFNHTPLDLYSQQTSDTTISKNKVFKIKLHCREDATQINRLFNRKKNFQLRLDANGLFTNETFFSFYQLLSPEIIPAVEYIEDPSSSLDWSWLSATQWSAAEDFLPGKPSAIKIYKPNREFWVPGDKRKKIFSSYQGSELGQWHAYQELMKFGDLSLYHGIEQPNLYEENLDLFQNGNTMSVVKEMYQTLHSLNWKELGVMT